MTTTRQPMTPETVREIAAESGLSHAEFCIEQDESQFGSEKLREARAEWERLEREAE